MNPAEAQSSPSSPKTPFSEGIRVVRILESNLLKVVKSLRHVAQPIDARNLGKQDDALNLP